MPAILTNNLSVINAENFVDSFINGNSTIYMAVGKGHDDRSNLTSTEQDTIKAWDNEQLPATPIDTINEQESFRNNIIGIKRIFSHDIMIMVPRVEWKVGKTFKPVNKAAVAGIRATDYFCINSNNEVWECVEKTNDATITEAGCMPLLSNVAKEDIESGNVKDVTLKTADGYTWKFLYNVTATMVNNGMLLENWMPVPFNKHGKYPGGTLTETQDISGDLNANRELGAYRVLVTCTLSDEGDKIPYNSIYRQIGLIVDPLSIADEDGNQTAISGENYAFGEFAHSSGELIYLENRRPTHRAENQSEVLTVMLIF